MRSVRPGQLFAQPWPCVDKHRLDHSAAVWFSFLGRPRIKGFKGKNACGTESVQLIRIGQQSMTDPFHIRDVFASKCFEPRCVSRLEIMMHRIPILAESARLATALRDTDRDAACAFGRRYPHNLLSCLRNGLSVLPFWLAPVLALVRTSRGILRRASPLAR